MKIPYPISLKKKGVHRVSLMNSSMKKDEEMVTDFSIIFNGLFSDG